MKLLERRFDTLVRLIDVLREAVRATRCERLFHINAWVIARPHALRLEFAAGRC